MDTVNSVTISGGRAGPGGNTNAALGTRSGGGGGAGGYGEVVNGIGLIYTNNGAIGGGVGGNGGAIGTSASSTGSAAGNAGAGVVGSDLTIVNGGAIVGGLFSDGITRANAITFSGGAINNGGTLGGTGQLPAVTVNSGGALAPGNSIGTVTVNGNLTFNAGSNYNIEVSPSAADRTNVTGTAMLAGTVNATYQAGSYTSKQYTILNAAGGITSTFGALSNISLPSNIIAALSYDASNVFLDLTLHYHSTFGGSALNINQQNVGNALTNYFNSTGGIPTIFTTLTANGLSQIAGATGASTRSLMQNNANQFINAVFGNDFGAGVPDGGALGFALAGDETALGYTPRSQASRNADEILAATRPVKVRRNDMPRYRRLRCISHHTVKA
ncbi:MAG: hypothetical protein HY056_16185 [Proteobacteria bacterium]|nr:hypothetical protein [Pseudomonadota bacterium]